MMKNPLLFLLVFLPFISLAQAPSDTVAFADANFKYTLLNQDIFVRPPIDTNQDGKIQYSEAAAVDTLIVGDPQASFNIQDLTGIEAFVNLIYLDCQNNQLTSLDLSQNTALQELLCFDNQLNSLNINQNGELLDLYCGGNSLNQIDVSQNINLEKLVCNQNHLIAIDVSNNINLKELFCMGNQLTDLNVNQNNQLIRLGCDNNSLTSLDIRNGANMDLIYFSAENNPDLTCIFVDDKTYSQNNPDWHKDNSSHYVETQQECDNLGVESFNLKKIKIYPNPVKTRLHFISGQGKIGKITIFNLRGKKILSKNSFQSFQTLNLTSFPSGIYLLKIFYKNQQLTRKIIKL